MTETTNQKDFFNASGLLSFVWKYKFPLIVVVLLASVISIFVSYRITPMYKSTVILFPTTSNSVSQTLITESQQRRELLTFGDDDDVEQLMQMLQASDIKARIIEKYNLFEHYEIKKDSKYPNTKLNKKYDSNVRISRTELMSVKVDVLDASPDTAMLIANDIVALVDSSFSRIQKERAQKAFDIVHYEYESHKEKIKNIEDSLAALNKLGVIEIGPQTEMFSEQYAIALASGNQKAAAELEKKLDILAEYGSIYSLLRWQLGEEIKRLASLEAKHREARIDLEQNLPNTYIVSPAEKPEKKAKPARMIIVSVSVIASFLFALIVLLFFDRSFKRSKD